MSYGSYGNQPDLQLGMPVHSDNGWSGTITEIIPAAPGYEGAVRVAWHGDGTTLVALTTFVVENGAAIIRTQPPPPPPSPAPPEPHAAIPDEEQTRLAIPHQQDPSHVNPYNTAPPLVAPEPPPINPTHGGQMRDLEATYIPPSSRESATESRAHKEYGSEPETFIPSASPSPAPPMPIPDSDATYIPPVSREAAPEIRTYESHDPAPAMPMPQPEAEAMAAGAMAGAPVPMATEEQQEMTVPVMEEQVEARPEWRDAGAITVRTVADEVPQTFTQETQREELFVERVAIGRELAEGEEVAPREEGDTYIIPVVVEEAIVVTRRILAEELRVTKRLIPMTQTVQAIVRKERVEIDGGELADRIHTE